MTKKTKRWIAMFISLFAVIFLLADCAQITRLKKEIRELKNREYECMDLLTLDQLMRYPINVEKKRQNLWEAIVMFTLRIYCENFYFPFEKKYIRLATDLGLFEYQWLMREYGMKGKKVVVVVFSSYATKDDLTGFDLAFVRNQGLCDKLASTGYTLVFTDNPDCESAGFLISIGKNKLVVTYKEDNIIAQGARFSNEFYAVVRKRRNENVLHEW